MSQNVFHDFQGARQDMWLCEKVLGSGGFGTVSLWVHQETNEEIAIKRCRNTAGLSHRQKQRWQMEIDIMNRVLNHPNIIQGVEVPAVLNVSENGLSPMGMEYCKGGDLRKLLTKPENCCGLPEGQILTILKDVSAGVEYLHKNRIIHRDLKPENIVMHENIEDEKTTYKIIDLGYAKQLDQNSLATSFVGTMQYLAPELVEQKKYSITVDYWTLGVVVFELICGIRPFAHRYHPYAFKAQLEQKQDDEIYGEVTEGRAIFLSRSLPRANHLCRTYTKYLENWLRLMLRWDQKARGGPLNEQKRAKCFTLLGSITSAKVAYVFCVRSCQALSFHISDDMSLHEFQVALERECNIPVADQELLLCSGVSADPTKSAEQFVMLDTDSVGACVCLFNKSDHSYPKELRHENELLPLVEKLLKSDEENNMRKRAWAQSVFYCRQNSTDFQKLLQSQQAAMLSLLRINTNFSKFRSQMMTNVGLLKARIEVFNDGHKYDTDHLVQQKGTCGIFSKQMYDSWTNISEEEVDVKKLDQQCAALSTKILQLQRSPFTFTKMKQAEDLDEISKKALVYYEEFLAKRREQTLDADNSKITRCVLVSCKHRNERTPDVYQNLSKVGSAKKELLQLLPGLSALVTKIEDSKLRLQLLQEKRQRDVWHLFKVALGSKALSPAPMATPLSVPVGPSSGGSSSDTEAWERAREESLMIMSDNKGMRERLHEMVESMHTVATMGTSNTPDWDVDVFDNDDANNKDANILHDFDDVDGRSLDVDKENHSVAKAGDETKDSERTMEEEMGGLTYSMGKMPNVHST